MEQAETVKKITDEFLDRLGVAGSVNVDSSDEEFKVKIDSEENALLIGKHGNTLSALEYILALFTAKKFGEYRRVLVEIGGYREDREKYLKELADRLRQEVVDSGAEKRISNLKPWERRLVHMYFSEDSEVFTESEGEDRDRVLVIKKK